LDGFGNWSFTTTALVTGDYVTATAYDLVNNTSEFCANMVVSGADWNCDDNPPPGKTAGGWESESNDGCAICDTAMCETAYCGDISPDGDEDWWFIRLPADTCYCLHVRVFGNDTPGQFAYGGGLDPVLDIYASDCSTVLFTNDNHGGLFPDAVGNDAQYDCQATGNCHQPGTQLYMKITGIAGSEGSYLLVVNCYPCECPEEPDTCDYYKSGYLDYCPNGMPDFDQKQNGWFNAGNQWTHCGPVALANCLWWFDSKFEPSPIDPRPFYPGPGNPAPNDGYPLVQSFHPLGTTWDDHDTNNVVPLVDSLALYCKTNTGTASGTYIDSMYQGVLTWLSNTGQSAYYTVNLVAVGASPGYGSISLEELKEEVLRSQDVILLLGFYHMPDPPYCERIGGHYVTVAGTCTDPLDSSLCISDPFFDKNEGEPPIGASGHGPTVHNDASLISGPHGTYHHDKYDIVLTLCGNIGASFFPLELANYGIDSSHAVKFQGINGGGTIPPLNMPIITLIEYALIICPLDSDEDGVPDLIDNCPYNYNPGQENSDGDSHGDACDNCPTVDNENQVNSDGDSHGDACDNCPTVDNESQTNSDGDSHGNACDNCDTVDNEDQANDDADTLGNACDNCPYADNDHQENSDGDSHGDACDNCPNDDNEDQSDIDIDNVGDVCDNCPTTINPLQTNSDADSLGDACDNCPNDDNDDQANNDGDSQGDVCDPDDDNDGINDDGDNSGTIGDNPCTGGGTTNCDDNCQFVYNPIQEDANSNGIGDACEGGCCTGKTGNADCSAEDQPDISDITRLIDYLYISHNPLCCAEEADVDVSGGEPDISDITFLIAHLYLDHRALPDCP
ncbi:MAG: thrombospondin type 3 repeat-containing protein, partial [candidate division Zixibacteria bacterium]|nr:thrombospondin type 3 repeat-containing protein [candidate division Zixibacteria bacterium]